MSVTGEHVPITEDGCVYWFSFRIIDLCDTLGFFSQELCVMKLMSSILPAPLVGAAIRNFLIFSVASRISSYVIFKPVYINIAFVILMAHQ